MRKFGIILAILAAFEFGGGLCKERYAHAQGCICVTDALTEYNTGITAKSVSTPGTATFTASQLTYSVINPSNFQQEFPGWVALPVKSLPIAQANTMRTLSTYLAAATDAQGQAGVVAALPQVPAVLATLQNIQVALQTMAQMQADQIQIEAVSQAEQLNEKARMMATEAGDIQQ
jgi:hypothetical protein